MKKGISKLTGHRRNRNKQVNHFFTIKYNQHLKMRIPSFDKDAIKGTPLYTLWIYNLIQDFGRQFHDPYQETKIFIPLTQ